MNESMNLLVIAGGLSVVLLMWAVLAYNRLVRLRNRAEESWKNIDTQLNRRWDLIPALVAAVRGVAAHEADLFERVSSARARSLNASPSPRAQAEADRGLKDSLTPLFAVVEDYPSLQANENFMHLQQSLEEVEDAIQRARRYYNAVIRDYNMSIESFPRNLLAGLFGFHPRQFFSLSGQEEAGKSAVRFR